MSTSMNRSPTHPTTFVSQPKGTYTSKFRVIVVLGAQLTPDGEPTFALRRRVKRGCALLRDALAQGESGVVILSGGATLGPAIASEAAVMERLCLAEGVEAGRLWGESRSQNTRQNAVNSLALVARSGVDPQVRLEVVTDWQHLPRAWWLFRVLQWRGARQGLWPKRGLRMVAAGGPSGWAGVRFALREAVACAAEVVRCWQVPLGDDVPRSGRRK